MNERRLLQKNAANDRSSAAMWRCWTDLNRRMRVLQTLALPLGYSTIMERLTRLELATSTLARWRSTR